MQNSLLPENKEALLRMNLFDIVGISDKDEKFKDDYLKEFTVLTSAIYLKGLEGKLSQEQLEEMKSHSEKDTPEELEKFINEKYPDFKGRFVTATFQAKEAVILQYMEKLKVLAAKKENFNKELITKLHELSVSASDGDWEDFEKGWKILVKIRERL